MKFIDVKTDPSSVYRETAMLEFPFTVSKVTDVPPEEECRGGGYLRLLLGRSYTREARNKRSHKNTLSSKWCELDGLIASLTIFTVIIFRGH